MSSEQSWWQTLPGILTAVAGCITAITALIAALNQAGVFKEEKAPPIVSSAPVATPDGNVPEPNTKKPAVPTVVQTSTVKPQAAAQETGESQGSHRLGALDDKALLDELARANVRYSVSERQMMSWLADDDRTFFRVGRASARLLHGKRVRGNAPDLDVIKYHYLEASGLKGDAVLPADARIDDAKLRQAIVTAFNEKNGTTARRIDGITDPR